MTGLWRGLGPNVARNAIVNAAELASFDQVDLPIPQLTCFPCENKSRSTALTESCTFIGDRSFMGSCGVTSSSISALAYCAGPGSSMRPPTWIAPWISKTITGHEFSQKGCVPLF